jgi:DNA-binding transcriptional ArsR family regulator
MKLCKDQERLEVCLTRRHAELCSVFSSPVRIEILLALGTEERTAGELAQAVGVAPPNLSQHLRVMRDQSAVRMHKEGRHVYYRVANPKFLQAVKLVREGLLEEIKLQHAVAEKTGL